MKTRVRLLLTLSIVMVASVYPASAQWHQTSGPYGGIIDCLAVDSAGPGDVRMFAGTTTAGLFRSTDLGASWSECNSGLTNSYVYSLGVSPGGRLVFAGTAGGGVYRSTDHGDSWMVVDSGLAGGSSDNLVVESIGVFVTASSDTIVLAGTYGGIFRSTNAGVSWTLSDSGYTYGSGEVDAILPVPDGSGGTIVIAGNRNAYLYLSTDNGVSWIESSNGLNSNNVFCLTNVGPTIFAGTYYGVYKIGLHDAAWTQVSNGLPIGQAGMYTNAIIASPDGSGGTNLVLSADIGCFISPDLGAHWSPLSNGLVNTAVVSLASVGTTLFAGTYGSGIFKIPSNGSAWVETNSGLLASSIQALAVVAQPGGGEFLYAGLLGNGMFHSTDDGMTWIRDIVTQPGNSIAVAVYAVASGLDSAGRQILYAGTGGGVYRSTDGGTTWSVGGGTEYWEANALAVRGTMVCASDAFVSTNAGATWRSTSGSGSGPVAIMPSGAGSVDLFASPPYAAVQVSPDTGKTWNSVSDNWHNLNPLAGVYWEVNVLGMNGTTLVAGTRSGVFVTADLGATWSTVNAGLADSAVHAFSTGSSVFAGANDGGVYLLTNFGTRWQSVNTGLPDAEIDALAQTGGYLFAGTNGRGLWRRPMSEIVTGVSNQLSPTTPLSYSLEQNFPNPFNPSTRIEYLLPSKGFVSIRVYDVLGREIETLVNKEEDPGHHTVTWQASSVASGVYFIQMKAGQYSEIRKALLLK